MKKKLNDILEANNLSFDINGNYYYMKGLGILEVSTFGIQKTFIIKEADLKMHEDLVFLFYINTHNSF